MRMAFLCHELEFILTMNWICFNGELVPADQPVLPADDKSFRYGDGVFETMKMLDGKIILGNFHFERLFASLKLLNFDLPDEFERSHLEKRIVDLAEKNKVMKLARVRVSISRGNGHIKVFKPGINYMIEATAMNEEVNFLNPVGLSLDVFEDGRKSMDRFSNIKSASMQLYSLAAIDAFRKNVDECLVLNTQNRIVDSTIANVFLVRKNLVITPSLSEGVVNGVMRRFLLKNLPGLIPDLEVREGVVTKSDLDVFDEVFLTNVIQGIRWVQRYRGRNYEHNVAKKAHELLSSRLYYS